jgi:putative N6-adenine-specific DNA methylase
MIRANIELRTASRVLVPILTGRVKSYDELYRLTRRVNWASIITPNQTLRVNAVTRDAGLNDERFAAVRVKDAITDSQRSRVRSRSSVSRKNPDVSLSLYVADGNVELSLDSSGAPLHERGYRTQAGEAPLRENLAAALLCAAEWNPSKPLLDPFCGSGTIAIEAALIASGIPPGHLRKHHGFDFWDFLDRSRVPGDATEDEKTGGDSAVGGAKKYAAHTARTIVASDIDDAMIEVARANAHRAGVSEMIHFETGDACNRQAPADSGVIVANPPYGERLSDEDAGSILHAWADHLKRHYGGWECFFLSDSKQAAKRFGMRTRVRSQMWNGGLQVNLYRAEIYRPKV